MKIVSFPRMGDYSVPSYYLLSHILNTKVLLPNEISDKTIEIGNKYSPNFVCMPFKYTLGTFLENLERGSNVFIQLGGGCRYGYYAELQEQILKDLGYSFEYYNLVSEGYTDLKQIIQKLKKINPKFNKFKSLYYLFISFKMMKYMDKLDEYIRKNIGFEEEKNSFIDLKKEMVNRFLNTKSFLQLMFNYRKYKYKFKKLPLKKVKRRFKVGIIGELYTIMEPYANYELEYMLAKYQIEIKRYTNATYLLLEKKRKVKKYLKEVSHYSKHRLGADALDNIGRMVELCRLNYDGVIHIKSSFCTPEIGVMPILRKVSQDYNMPILFFSFDSNTSKVGLETRIEAFYDMIEMRRKK